MIEASEGGGPCGQDQANGLLWEGGSH